MASGIFNCAEWDAWYFEKLSRPATIEKLLGQPHGTFLVRDSMTCPGDYVLSVSENSKVSHYIINKKQNALKIGDQAFTSMTQLLEFYKVHYLDTTTLINPLLKIQVNRSSTISFDKVPTQLAESSPIIATPEASDHDKIFVQGLFDFDSTDPDDLAFRKGEILEIIGKPEENWWTARNKENKIGQIPVPYVGSLTPGRNSISVNYQLPPQQQQMQGRPVSMPTVNTPVFAKVVTKRVGNAYDPSALSLEVGDVITVHKMNTSGQWEGECKGKVGLFPFTHVKIIDQPNQQQADPTS